MTSNGNPLHRIGSSGPLQLLKTMSSGPLQVEMLTTHQLIHQATKAHEASMHARVDHAPQLILTKRGALEQCVFKEMDQLRAGAVAQLKLLEPRHHSDVVAARMRVYELDGVVETSHQIHQVSGTVACSAQRVSTDRGVISCRI